MIAHNYIYHYQEPKTAGSVPLADAPDDTSGPTAKPREGDAAAAGGQLRGHPLSRGASARAVLSAAISAHVWSNGVGRKHLQNRSQLEDPTIITSANSHWAQCWAGVLEASPP